MARSETGSRLPSQGDLAQAPQGGPHCGQGPVLLRFRRQVLDGQMAGINQIQVMGLAQGGDLEPRTALAIKAHGLKLVSRGP